MAKRIKHKRTFSVIRDYGWLFTFLVAIGGLFVPKLGLLVLLIMLSLTIMSFFKGRYWCGNFCPHGSLFDKLLLPPSFNRKIPDFFKSKFMIVAFFIFFMYNWARRLISIFGLWGSYDFLDRLGMLFVNTYLMVLIVGGLTAILVTPRFWCQFCPMGTMQKISYGISKKLRSRLVSIEDYDKKLTISDRDKCKECGKCSFVCPFQLEPHKNFDENNEFNDINCIKCSTCVAACPLKILEIK